MDDTTDLAKAEPTAILVASEPPVAVQSIAPQVGQVFNVKRLDGELLPAEVLETRANEKEKKTEYFVHFENCSLPLFKYTRVSTILIFTIFFSGFFFANRITSMSY
jgi:hypothetical protein